MIFDNLPTTPAEARRIAQTTLDPREAAVMLFHAISLEINLPDVDDRACRDAAWAECQGVRGSFDQWIGCYAGFYLTCMIPVLEAAADKQFLLIEQKVIDEIGNAALNVNIFTEETALQTRQAISSSIQSITSVVDNFESQIAATLGPPVQAIANFLDNLDVEIASIIEAGTVPIIAFLDTVTDDFSETVTSFLQTNEQLFTTISEDVTGVIGDLVTTIQTGVDILAADPEAFRLIITDFIDGLPDLISNQIRQPIADKIGIPAEQNIFDWITSFLTDKAEETVDASKVFVDNLPISEEQKDAIRQATQGIGTPSFVKLWYTITTSVWLFISEFTRGKEAAAAKSRMFERTELKFERASPDEIIASHDRGFLFDSEYEKAVNETGLPITHINLKNELLRARLNLPEIWSIHRRGFTNKELHDRLLRQIGLEGISAALSEKATQFIASPGDLIRFMVREVFNPEISRLFGLDEEFPEVAIEEGDKLGVPEETMRQFWAAHWELPSVQMGFDMKHREIIDKPELAALLKAKDIMPFWREKLMGLSDRLITRVDIRRIHSLGIKDLAWVSGQYRKRGYSEDDADNLTEFTKQLNAPDDPSDDDDFTALTRALVIKSFKESIISDNTAFGILESLGYGPDNAGFIMSLASMEKEIDVRREGINIIKNNFRAGVINFEQAQSALGGIGATVPEREKAVAQFENIRKSRTTLPTVAQLKELFSAQIIGRTDVVSALEGRGYSDFWTSAFTNQITQGGGFDEN